MYNQIIGYFGPNLGTTHAYIWVLPKSGTVFTDLFISKYRDLISGIDKPIDAYRFPSIRPHFFNKTDFVVEHGGCPGYYIAEQNLILREKWVKLGYYTSGWAADNARKTYIFEQMKNNNEAFLSNMKIVFIFRNPLDQLISYHRHQINSFTDDHKYRVGFNAKNTSLEDFIFNEGGLDSYIKELYTYIVVAQKYPGMIMFVPYESIMDEKYEVFKKIFEHLDIPVVPDALQKTIDETNMDVIKALENRINGSISRDQCSSEERHVRNGNPGAWITKMDPDMIYRIEQKLQEFNLSLNMFDLGVDLSLDERFKFLFLSDTNVAKLRVNF